MATTPTQPTFAVMKTRVLSYLGVEPDDDNKAIVGVSINEAIDVLNTYVWRKILASEDITMVEGTGEYTVDTSMESPRHAFFIDASSRPILNGSWCGYLDQKTFELKYPNRDTNGSPTHYTLLYDTREIALSVPPDASFVSSYPTMRVRYYPRLQHLSADGDQLDVATAEFSTYCIWYARWLLAISRDRTSQADRAERMAERILSRLRTRDNENMEDFS